MAQITIQQGADLAWIMDQAGQPHGPEDDGAWFDGNTLHCNDVTQGSLDSACATYDHDSYAAEQNQNKLSEQKRREASEEILAIAPEWKQRNLLAQVCALLVRHAKADEFPEVIPLIELWEKIDKIRTDSNDLKIPPKNP